MNRHLATIILAAALLASLAAPAAQAQKLTTSGAASPPRAATPGVLASSSNDTTPTAAPDLSGLHYQTIEAPHHSHKKFWLTIAVFAGAAIATGVILSHERGASHSTSAHPPSSACYGNSSAIHPGLCVTTGDR